MAARIAVVTHDAALLVAIRRVAATLEAEVVDATSHSGVTETSAGAILSQRPTTVLLGSGLPLEQMAALTEQIDALKPEVIVTWITEPTADTWRIATQTGARDLFSPGLSDEILRDNLARVVGIGDRRLQHQGTLIDTSGETVSKGRIVSVVSPKGGSGKTMLSTNLAVGLQERSPADVVLVDLDLQFGDVASALGLQPEYTIADLLRSPGDATAMKAFLTPHPSGLSVLPAPANPVEAEDIEPGQIAKLLDALSMEFSYVVVDTGAGIDEATLTAIEASSDLMFVTTIDVAAIQAMRKLIIVLDRLQLDTHQRWFVLNRATSRTGLSKSEIQEVTGLAIDVEVPSHRSVSASMNQGSPAIFDQRRKRVGKSFAAAADLLLDGSRKRKGTVR